MEVKPPSIRNITILRVEGLLTLVLHESVWFIDPKYRNARYLSIDAATPFPQLEAFVVYLH